MPLFLEMTIIAVIASTLALRGVPNIAALGAKHIPYTYMDP